MTEPYRSPLNPGAPIRDANSEVTLARLLGVNGRAGWVDDADLYPRLRTNRETQQMAIQTVDLDMVAPKRETEDEAELRRMASDWLERVVEDAKNGLGDRGTVLAQVVEAFWLAGHYVAEVGFRGPQGERVLEVYWIHHSTIAEWVRDPEDRDRIIGVRQSTPVGSRVIPAERLVMLHWGGPGPTGVPGYRVMLSWADSGKTALRSLGGKQSADQGLLKFTMSQGAGEKAYEFLRSYIADEGVGTLTTGQPYVIIDPAQGLADVEVVFAASGQGDPSAWMRYLDSVADHRMWMQMASLGATAGTGSRALGEVMADNDADNLTRFLRILIRGWSRAVMRVVVGILRRAGVVYTGRVPVLDIARGETEASLADQAAMFVQLAPYLGASAGRVAAHLAAEAGIPAEVLRDQDIPTSSAPGAQDVTVSSDAGPGKDAALWGYEGVGVLRSLVDSGILPLTPALRRYAAKHVGGLPDDLIDALGLDTAPTGVQKAPEQSQGVDAHACVTDCGHAVHMAASTTHTDAYGRAYSGCKALEQMSDVERYVAWGALEEQLGGIDERLERRIGEIADAHREALRSVLADLPLDTSGPKVDARLTDVSTGAYQGYYRAVADAAEESLRTGREHAAREADAQVPGGRETPREGQSAPAVADVARSEVMRARAQAGAAAQAIYQRVIGEMRAAWAGGADMATWVTRQTPTGLAGEARGVIYTSETAGRLAESSEIAETSGMVIVSVQRSSVRDARRCSHCASLDGGEHPDVGVWDVSTPEGVAAYVADPNKQTPDPLCEGGAQRCRCGLLTEWAPADEV